MTARAPAWWRWAAALASCSLLAVVAYLPGLPGEFVYDDHRLITDNDGLKRPFDPSRAFLRDYYASDLDRTGLGYYRPLSILSNELDYRLGGGGPLPFHLTNLLLHLAATMGVFALARRLAPGRIAAPLVAAGLFAVHPAHAESVAFISGRVDPLATVFVLATILLHLRANAAAHPGPWRAAAASAWLLGLLSKEMAVTAPVLAAVLEVGLEGRPALHELRSRASRYLPYLPVAGIYIAARVAALGHLLSPGAEGSAWSLAKPLIALGTYLRWLVLPPFALNLEPESTGVIWVALAVLAILAAIGAAGLSWRRGLRLELAVASAAVLALVPVLQLKPLETALSERFLYSPSAFAMTLAGVIAARSRPPRARAVMWTVVVSLAALYLTILVPRSRLWRDEIELWTAKDGEDGGSLKARLNIAQAQHRRGNDAAARFSYERAMELEPGLASLIRGEMSTLTSSDSAGRSIDDLRRAIWTSPTDGSMWSNLGFLLYERGDLPGAAAAFARATALTPLRALGWLGSALVKLRQGDFDGAEVDATRAFQLDPALGIARAIRGECLFRRGRACEALAVIDGVRLEDPSQQASFEQLRAAAAAACPGGR